MNRSELCRILRLHIKKAKGQYCGYDDTRMLKLVETFGQLGVDALDRDEQAALLLLIDYAFS